MGLPPSVFFRYPQSLSGGQRQRVNLARAFLIRPDIFILDEPLAALDISIQAQVLNLLHDLREEYNPTILFISHDLETVKFFCDDVMIMYFGKIVEYGPVENIFQYPRHPYTRQLIKSSPTLHHHFDWNEHLNEGHVPSFFDPPVGCAYASRCSYAQQSCHKEKPTLSSDSSYSKSSSHPVACFFPLQTPMQQSSK
jgi:peptide/nickel transport system ATP-binding protein